MLRSVLIANKEEKIITNALTVILSDEIIM